MKLSDVYAFAQARLAEVRSPIPDTDFQQNPAVWQQLATHAAFWALFSGQDLDELRAEFENEPWCGRERDRLFTEAGYHGPADGSTGQGPIWELFYFIEGLVLEYFYYVYDKSHFWCELAPGRVNLSY